MERLLLEFTAGSGARNWLEAVGRSNSDSLRALGDDYLRSAAKYRRTDCPIFTDKMPNNWSYVGLIHLMLPGAKIIDVRRHPLACCFATFALYFRSEEHTSELQSLMRISYAVFCLKKKNQCTAIPEANHSEIH